MSVPVGMRNLLTPDDKGDALVGRCRAMQEVFKAIGRVAPQDVTVLIRGESGTGKELVARAIYQHGARSEGPFLAVNCAALSETLLESGAVRAREGRLHRRRTSGGSASSSSAAAGPSSSTRSGDMSPLVQGKVLRLLQEQKFERVGGNETITTDVRIISATNRDLEAMCEEGKFRDDLYYRLNGYTITLPPLRDREEDRILLLEHFLAQLNRELGRDVQGIAPEALQRLLEYDWPGNIRELQGVLRQAVLQCSDQVLVTSVLPAEVQPAVVRKRPTSSTNSETVGDYGEEEAAEADITAFIAERLQGKSQDLYAETLEFMEKELLTLVLKHAGGNQSEASRILGITRGSLRNKIRTNGISIESAIEVAE